jgi:hypothetical protein
VQAWSPSWNIVTVLAAGLLLASAATLNVALTNDGPNHLLAAWVHHQSDLGGVSEFYALAVPPTAHGFHEVARTLLAVGVDVWTTGQLAVVVSVAFLAFAMASFVWVNGGRAALPVAFALPLCKLLLLGLFPFISGLAVGLFAVVAARGLSRRPGPLRAILTAFLLYAAARCHVVAASLCGITLLLLEVGMAGLRGLIFSAAVGTPACAVALEVRNAAGRVAVREELGPTFNRLLELPDASLGGPLWRGGFLLVVLVLAASATLLTRCVERSRRVLAGVGLGLIALGACLPRDIAGWQFAGDRPLVLGILCCLPSLDALPTASRRLAGIAVAAWTLASSAWFLTGVLDVSDRLAGTARAALAAQDTGFIRVPLRAGQEEVLAEDYSPLFHIDHLVTMGGGGASIMGQATRDSDHFLRLVAGEEAVTPREIPEGPVTKDEPLATWDVLPLKLGTMSLVRGLTFVGSAEDVAFLQDVVGYDLVYRAESLAVLRLSGCSVRIELGGAPRAGTISLGYWPSRFAARAYDYSFDSEKKTRTLVVAPLPCGELWVRVDGMDCQEADQDGFIRIPAVRPRASATAACTPR